MQYQVNLAAGAKTRQDTGGNYFVLLDTGAASSVEIWLMRNSEELEYIRTAKRGLKLTVPDGFTHLFIKSAGAAVVCEIVVSRGRVDVGFIDGVKVDATIVSPLPLPVSNDRGTPAVPVYVASYTANDAPATGATNNAPVAAGPAAVVLAAADATRRELRVTNLGPDPVALGAAGITWANRAVVLQVGDIWVETRGANLAWSVITDAAKAASVTWQGVNA